MMDFIHLGASNIPIDLNVFEFPVISGRHSKFASMMSVQPEAIRAILWEKTAKSRPSPCFKS